jgi:hypothetical protein
MANTVKIVGIGVIVWLLVWALVRVLGTSVFSAGNPWLIVFYVASFPLGILFTVVIRVILNVPMQEMLQPIALLGVVALMLDGFSFAFTDVYGVGEHEIYSAAFLLWAPGVFLLCALWLVNRAAQTAAK